MITEIRDGRPVDRIAHEITDAEAHRVTVDLAAQGIRVEPVVDADHVLHLWAKELMSTAQEVCALQAYLQHHDGRAAWHGAGA